MRKTPRPASINPESGDAPVAAGDAHTGAPLQDVRHLSLADADPLEGLSLFTPLPRVLTSITEQPYVHISKAALSFSAKAVHEYRLHSYKTMSMFYEGEPGAITRLVVHLGGPVMRITHPKSTYGGRKVSAWSLVRSLRLEVHAGKRYALKSLAPGYVEIDLGSVIDIPEEMRRAGRPSKREVAA